VKRQGNEQAQEAGQSQKYHEAVDCSGGEGNMRNNCSHDQPPKADQRDYSSTHNFAPGSQSIHGLSLRNITAASQKDAQIVAYIIFCYVVVLILVQTLSRRPSRLSISLKRRQRSCTDTGN
jgi:hypothetical protein